MLSKVEKRWCYRDLFKVKCMPLQYLVNFSCTQLACLACMCILLWPYQISPLKGSLTHSAFSIWIKMAQQNKSYLQDICFIYCINGTANRNCWKQSPVHIPIQFMTEHPRVKHNIWDNHVLCFQPCYENGSTSRRARQNVGHGSFKELQISPQRTAITLSTNWSKRIFKHTVKNECPTMWEQSQS